MKTFEEKLKTLEKLSNDIKQSDIPLEDALAYFEEGIKLARGMEKDLDKIEGKITMLMNNPVPNTKDEPELDLFSATDDK